MHFLFSFYYELTAATCFEHYLLIIRRHCIQQLVYFVRIAWVGWLLPGLEWSSTPNLVAANSHNTHAIYQVLFVQHLLMMSK
jgi:hypothetical protein